MKFDLAKLAKWGGYITAIAGAWLVIIEAVTWLDSQHADSLDTQEQFISTQIKETERDLKATAEAYHFFQLQEVEGTLTPVQAKRLEFLGRQVDKKQSEVNRLEEKLEALR